MAKYYKIKKSAIAVTPIWWCVIVMMGIPFGLLLAKNFGVFDLPQMLIDQKIVEMDYKQLNSYFTIIALAIGLIGLFIVAYRIWCAKLVHYEIQSRMLVEKRSRLFFMLGKDEVCKTMFLPAGMVVSISQSIKGFLFNYGDVIISMGIGGDSQIVLHGVKRPRKVKRLLSDKMCNSGNMMFFNTSF